MNVLDVVRAMAQGGAPVEQAEELVRTLAHSNGYVKDVDWTLRETAAIYASRGKRNVTAEVTQYVDMSSGYFSSSDVDRDLQLLTTAEKHARRTALYQLAQQGVVERHRSKNGVYRRVDHGIEVLDWKHAEMTELPLRWPFGLEEWEITYPGTLDVIAGSSGAGKTAFMLNFLYLNQGSHLIRYMTSEMSKQQMKSRLSKFNIGEDEWQFEPIRCSRGFADKILPDSVNVIDYLEVDGENPSMVVNELRDIFDALKSGFVLVGLQKKQDERRYSQVGKQYSVKYNLGRGGEFSKEKARLYIVMDFDELRIEKASNRRDDDAPPLKGRRWGFRLYKGCRFEDVYEKTEEEE